jgi:hypothetical protein
MLGARNRIGLTERQIATCQTVWTILCEGRPKPLDISEADRHGSRTRYDQRRKMVILGADAYRGSGQTANARMSVVACLAHELAHLMRHDMGFDRPIEFPDAHLDEAETSVFASFIGNVEEGDRTDLIEDARDRLINWIAFRRETP